MNGEKSEHQNESLAQLSCMDESLNKVLDNPSLRYPLVVKNAYIWLHEKLHSYLFSPQSSKFVPDLEQLTQYLTIRKNAKNEVSRALDAPGFGILLDFSIRAFKHNVMKENVTLKPSACLEQLMLQIEQSQNVAVFDYCLQHSIPVNDIGSWRDFFVYLRAVHKYGQLCAKISSQPNITEGILKMIEGDSSDLASQIVAQKLTQQQRSPDFDPVEEKGLRKSLASKIKEHQIYAKLMILNAVLGVTEIQDLALRTKKFTYFESQIKRNIANECWGI